MTPSDFVNYAKDRNCELEPKEFGSYYKIVNKELRTYTYLYRYHKVLLLDNAIAACLDLHIEIITERMYDSYE